MLRVLAAVFFTSMIAFGATVRLYLKDGTYQLVREYQVLQDRIKYYSTERGDWEEISKDLVDLKRTQTEAKQREESQREEAAAAAAEDKAERAAREEVERVPVEPGVHLVAGDQLKTIPPAESKIVGNKRRTILKAITPIPIVAGKGTVEIEGLQSKNVVDSDRPEFYIRLSREQRFGILRLAPGKAARIVEEIQIIPVSKEIIEKHDSVEVFRRLVGDSLYKIWPMKPLEPGEYAVVEYSPPGDSGSLNIQIWDFSWPGRK
jgi:hypothetical protein